MPKNKKIKPHELQHRISQDLAQNNQNPTEGFPTRIFHAVNPGDLIAAMGAVKKFWEITKRKAIIYQSVEQLAMYYQGAVHPTKNSVGENVCCNEPMFNMLKPLIESQEYIRSFEMYQGQQIDLDFNVIRGKTNVNLPQGAIQGWIPLAYPDLAFDISKSWMKVDGECPRHIKKQVKGKIILNFTERYRNNFIDYFFLKNYAPDLVFAGTEKEYYLFCNKWQLAIPQLKVNDFLELAHAIKESRFLLGNQSMCINIAYALGTPRITEICNYAQNVIHNIGEDCYGFLYNTGLEYYWRMLYNRANK